MNEQKEEKPKIVVDTDWKAQVEAEKENLRRHEGESATTAASPGPAAKSKPAATEAESEGALPPASFSFLVTSLATQAMAALGQYPDPIENKPVVRLSHARHYIDLLGVLESKTQGNLSADEKALLAHVLTDLRMGYVAVEKRLHAKR